jgi:hypothetical protein
MRNPQSKLKCETEQELKDAASKPYFCRVQKINWDGPGWYYIFRYSQRCPRNCCDDDVFEAISAKKRAEDLADEIRKLASQLRDVRTLGEQND